MISSQQANMLLEIAQTVEENSKLQDVLYAAAGYLNESASKEVYCVCLQKLKSLGIK